MSYRTLCSPATYNQSNGEYGFIDPGCQAEIPIVFFFWLSWLLHLGSVIITILTFKNKSTQYPPSPAAVSSHPNNTLDFDNNMAKGVFVFFRLAEIVLTPTTLSFVAYYLSISEEVSIYSSTSTVDGGSIFALLTVLWSFLFLVYRVAMGFKPALDTKATALSLELLNLFLLLISAITFTCTFTYSTLYCVSFSAAGVTPSMCLYQVLLGRGC